MTGSSPIPTSISSSPASAAGKMTMSTTSPSPARMSPPGKGFYAGAKFETHPSCTALPPPPTHWTTPNSRSQSQSQPSSALAAPIIKTVITSKSPPARSPTTFTSNSISTTTTATNRFTTPINLMALFASARTNAEMHHVSVVHFNAKPIST